MRRATIVAVVLLLGVGAFLHYGLQVRAAAPLPKVELNADGAEPRSVEDATRTAIARDYSTAWQNLAVAMEQNRLDPLAASFVGLAREKFSDAIAAQRKAGLRRRFVDRGHRLEAVFYSYDGSAMQLKDAAQVEVQLLDGDKVVATEPATVHYVVLMTPAENSWKVRDLEAVPNF